MHIHWILRRGIEMCTITSPFTGENRGSEEGVTCPRSHHNCHTLPPLIYCWSFLDQNPTLESWLQAGWMPLLVGNYTRADPQMGQGLGLTLLSCMSLLAPFLRRAKVASTLLTAAAQCKADFPGGRKKKSGSESGSCPGSPRHGSKKYPERGLRGRSRPLMNIWAPVCVCVQTCPRETLYMCVHICTCDSPYIEGTVSPSLIST